MNTDDTDVEYLAFSNLNGNGKTAVIVLNPHGKRLGFMHKRYLIYFIALGVLLSSCEETDPFYQELAFYYAPVHYQDTDATNPEADFITRIDYDGDWTTTNNWENLESGDLSAWGYYSVVESCTHWFIIYAFFHPRDWSDGDAPDNNEHENDLEGLLSIVRKDGSEFGELLGIITVFHEDFYSYTPKGSTLTDGSVDIAGELSWERVNGSLHLKTSQEAEGHGLKAWPFAGQFRGENDEDGIIYYPSRITSMVPSSGNDRNVSYRLIDFNAFGNLWTFQILDSVKTRDQATTFATWGALKGDEGGGCGDGLLINCSEDAANAPWHWDDEDDGPTYAGEMALDPAHLVDYYFGGLGNFSHKYLRNKYLENLRDNEFGRDNLPRGWPDELNLDELYTKLTATCQ